MKRFNNYHSLNIFELSLTQWEFPIHKHNFYELIFIQKGSGTHVLNELSFGYKTGDVFLLRPEDAHYFNIGKPTDFIFLRFNEQLFIEKLEGGKTAKWMEVIKTLLQNPSAISGSLVTDAKDQKHLQSLLQFYWLNFLKPACIAERWYWNFLGQ